MIVLSRDLFPANVKDPQGYYWIKKTRNWFCPYNIMCLPVREKATGGSENGSSLIKFHPVIGPIWRICFNQFRGGYRGRVQGVCTPPPGDEAFFFVFAFKICLPHRSVKSFLRGAPPPKKNPGSAPVITPSFPFAVVLSFCLTATFKFEFFLCGEP